MASAEDLSVLKELQARPENRMCVDCETKNPQWASVNYGVFMCLECSGKHRSLGVHISFVRSVNMDSWKPVELKKMQCGGNRQANEFFQQYGVPKTTPIETKYHSKAAELYRESIRAAAEGRKYQPPPPSEVKRMEQKSRQQASLAKSNSGQVQRPKKSSGDDWNDWGGGPFSNKGNSKARNGPTIIEQASSNLGMSAAAIHASKEDFFSRKVRENSQKPEGLPPSQGGRCVGFGSTPAPTGTSSSYHGRHSGDVSVDDVTAALATGWNKLSGVATNVASQVKQTETGERLMVGAGIAASKGKEYGQKGWNTFQSIMRSAVSTVKDAVNDVTADDYGDTRNGMAGMNNTKMYGSDGGGGYQSGFSGFGDSGPAAAPAPAPAGPTSARLNNSFSSSPAPGSPRGVPRRTTSKSFTASRTSSAKKDDSWGDW